MEALVDGKSHAVAFVFVAIAHSLQAQSAWLGLPPLDKKLFFKKNNSKPCLVLIPFGSQDLGALDGSIPVQTSVRLLNVGGAPFKIFAPSQCVISRVRVQFPGNGDLALEPGDAIQIPVEYDGRLDEGATSFEVAFQTNDPEAPVLRQEFQAHVRKSLPAFPFRDCLQGRLECGQPPKPLAISFISDGTSRFLGASIEDETAPLVITESRTVANNYQGTVSLDLARIQQGKCSKRGETRIFGVTDTGRKAYTWIQWSVE